MFGPKQLFFIVIVFNYKCHFAIKAYICGNEAGLNNRTLQ